MVHCTKEPTLVSAAVHKRNYHTLIILCFLIVFVAHAYLFFFGADQDELA